MGVNVGLSALLVVVCWGIVHTQVDFDDPCASSGRAGQCLSLLTCPVLRSLLQNSGRPIPSSVKKTLQTAHCGFERDTPKVCCPPDATPTPTPTVTIPTQTVSTETGFYSEPPPDITGHPNLPLITSDQCGSLDDNRILGGNKTGLLEFPWMVLIAYNSRNRISFRCGGTIINERYILTAAHCVSNLGSRLTIAGVRVGEHNTKTADDCEGLGEDRFCNPPIQDMAVEEAIAHPDYSPTKLQNDIAVIRLATPIDFSKENAKPICLPITRQLQLLNLVGKRVIVAGWGATEQGTQSADLLKVDLPVITNPDCGAVHNKSVAAGISFKQMCAGGLNGKDSCGGDSGGPLKYPGFLLETVRYIQYGIVSFGPKRCGTTGSPGVYTRVPYYMDWILDTIKP